MTMASQILIQCSILSMLARVFTIYARLAVFFPCHVAVFLYSWKDSNDLTPAIFQLSSKTRSEEKQNILGLIVEVFAIKILRRLLLSPSPSQVCNEFLIKWWWNLKSRTYDFKMFTRTKLKPKYIFLFDFVHGCFLYQTGTKDQVTP